jgi:hypothetical protein
MCLLFFCKNKFGRCCARISVTCVVVLFDAEIPELDLRLAYPLQPEQLEKIIKGAASRAPLGRGTEVFGHFAHRAFFYELLLSLTYSEFDLLVVFLFDFKNRLLSI